MNEECGLILALPVSPAQPICWWHLDKGAIVSSGKHTALDMDTKLADILTASDDMRVMAVLAASETAIYFANWPDLTSAQASAAATIQASEKSMIPREETHVTSAAIAHDIADSVSVRTVSASVNSQYLGHWLDKLALAGIDPDIIIPAGLLLPQPTKDAVSGNIGNGAMLRTAQIIFSNEEPLRKLLLGEMPVSALDANAMHTQMISAFAEPPLNMRQGMFAKKRTFKWLTDKQIRTLAAMAGALALLTLAIFLIQIGKYSFGADQVKSRALLEAQQTFPAATDIASAEQMADAELHRRGLGGRLFTVPTSALFSAIEPLAGISVRQMSYQADGTVAVTLAAARKEDIDSALILLQRQGYAVTVPPALTQDATGSVVANITVRAL